MFSKKESVLDLLESLKHLKNFEKIAEKQLIGKIVLTRYEKIY